MDPDIDLTKGPSEVFGRLTPGIADHPDGEQVWVWRVHAGQSQSLIRRYRVSEKYVQEKGYGPDDIFDLDPDSPWWTVPESLVPATASISPGMH